MRVASKQCDDVMIANLRFGFGFGPIIFGVLPIMSFIFTLRRTLYLVELCKQNKFKAHKTCPELSTART